MLRRNPHQLITVAATDEDNRQIDSDFSLTNIHALHSEASLFPYLMNVEPLSLGAEVKPVSSELPIVLKTRDVFC